MVHLEIRQTRVMRVDGGDWVAVPRNEFRLLNLLLSKPRQMIGFSEVQKGDPAPQPHTYETAADCRAGQEERAVGQPRLKGSVSRLPPGSRRQAKGTAAEAATGTAFTVQEQHPLRPHLRSL